MKHTVKWIASAFMALMVAGCSVAPTTSSSSTTQTSDLQGSITASGSSALLPLVQQAADTFMKEHPNVIVTVSGGGSGTGLKQVSQGAVDIGNSDVYAEEKLEKDQAAQLVDHKVATVLVGAVVNKELGVNNLTKQQLIEIFTGKITNWKDVGGKDLPIMLITRPASSGTRALFAKHVLDGASEASTSALETDDSGTLVQTLKDNVGAIGYVAYSYILKNPEIMGVAIDGNEPTLDNMYAGKYHVWGYEHMYTKGEATSPSKEFLEYMTSSQFEEKVESLGYGVPSKLSKEATNTHE